MWPRIGPLNNLLSRLISMRNPAFIFISWSPINFWFYVLVDKRNKGPDSKYIRPCGLPCLSQPPDRVWEQVWHVLIKLYLQKQATAQILLNALTPALREKKMQLLLLRLTAHVTIKFMLSLACWVKQHDSHMSQSCGLYFEDTNTTACCKGLPN
jgi:hypothetical protein